LAKIQVKVNSGHIITSILNTREQDIEVPNPVVKVVELRDRDACETAVIGVADGRKAGVHAGTNLFILCRFMLGCVWFLMIAQCGMLVAMHPL
jgi:hypothetical protein